MELTHVEIAAKQPDADPDLSTWERKPDQSIYALYGLTPQEIKIVQKISNR